MSPVASERGLLQQLIPLGTNLSIYGAKGWRGANAANDSIANGVNGNN